MLCARDFAGAFRLGSRKSSADALFGDSIDYLPRRPNRQ
jgi:hypothetical protein